VSRPRTVDDDAILSAVSSIIERHGPAAVTFARVADEVGLSSATLVQRFGTKRKLLLATTIRGWNTLLKVLTRPRTNTSPLETLITGLTELTATVSTREAIANGIAFLHIDLSDEEFHRHTMAGAGQMRKRIEQLLSEAVEAGELGPTDTQRLAAAVQATYNGALITWAMLGDGSVQEWVRSQIEFLLHSFKPSLPTRTRARSAAKAGLR
jgi:AcrR family transcriptional regulator